ncbi:hypothetical protein YC2023_013389 [Brassica napus]
MVDVPFFRFAVSLTAASYRPESGDESRRFHSPKRRRSPNLPVGFKRHRRHLSGRQAETSRLAHCGSERPERPGRIVGNSRSNAVTGSNVTIWDKEEPLINMFGDKKLHYPQGESCWEEDKHMFGTERVYNTMKMELETYMDYDDWNLAQNLIVNRCDPLPTSRCLARAS